MPFPFALHAEFPEFLVEWKAPYITAPGGLYNILEARLLSLPPLPSRQVLTWRQLVNEFFISSEDITLSSGYLKGWRIFKMTAVFESV